MKCGFDLFWVGRDDLLTVGGLGHRWAVATRAFVQSVFLFIRAPLQPAPVRFSPNSITKNNCFVSWGVFSRIHFKKARVTLYPGENEWDWMGAQRQAHWPSPPPTSQNSTLIRHGQLISRITPRNEGVRQKDRTTRPLGGEPANPGAKRPKGGPQENRETDDPPQQSREMLSRPPAAYCRH